MSDQQQIEWKKELRVLLDQIQARPSKDWTEQRGRIRLLNDLIASHERAVAA